MTRLGANGSTFGGGGAAPTADGSASAATDAAVWRRNMRREVVESMGSAPANGRRQPAGGGQHRRADAAPLGESFCRAAHRQFAGGLRDTSRLTPAVRLGLSARQ